MSNGKGLTGEENPIYHSMTSNYTLDMLRCYADFFQIKSLNHAPHQCYSGPRMMIYVWICYPAVLLVLYEACSTYDRGKSRHRLKDDLQIYPRHAQVLCCFTMPFETKILNHTHHQWYSCPMMMKHV